MLKIKLQKPKEFIYCLLYKESHNTEYLCKELYDKERNSRVLRWVQELCIDDYIKKTEKPGDRRYKSYYADPKYLYESIIQTSSNWSSKVAARINKEMPGITSRFSFTTEDEKTIMKLLSSYSFKQFISREINTMIYHKDTLLYSPFCRIKSCISEYCHFLYFIAENIGLHPFSNVLKYGEELFPPKSRDIRYLAEAFVDANPNDNLVNVLGYLLDNHNSYMFYYLRATMTLAKDKKFL